jgi:transcriptional regulator GlxA family with amidase domain
MASAPSIHRVVVLAVAPVVTFDLAIPYLVFGEAVTPDGPLYDVRTCAFGTDLVPTSADHAVAVSAGLEALADAGTVVVPGTVTRAGYPPEVLTALRRAAAAGTRVVAICTGAFVLAEAGLLDGRKATTHWAQTELLAKRYPQVEVDHSAIFVDDGGVFTSAGLAAGIDLCVHLVGLDHGAAVAADVARFAVISAPRPGRVPQLVSTPTPKDATLSVTRQWALEHLDTPLTLADLAGHAGLSIRSLSRRFRAETGESPLQWLLEQRLRRARALLETTGLSAAEVARGCGLGTADNLRLHFVQRTGLTPTAYRRAATAAA